MLVTRVFNVGRAGTQSRGTILLDNIVLCMTFLGCLVPAGIAVLGLILNYNFSYFLLEEFFLTTATNRSNSEIFLSFFARAALVSPGIFEILRTGAFFLNAFLSLTETIGLFLVRV